MEYFRTSLRTAAIVVLSLQVAAGCADGQSTTEFSLDVSRLSPDSVQFAFVHQEQQIGETVTHLTNHGGTWTFRERTEVPAGFQETTVTFGPGPTMKQVDQRGQMGPLETEINVSYGGDRAEGRAIVPTASGLDTIKVDAAVPRGVIDDNVLRPLFPAMTLAPGMKFSLPVFSSGKNQVTDYQFAVEAGQPLDWMGKQVETLKVVASGPVQLTYVVTEQSPHRVLRIQPPGPMTVVRMEPTE